MRPLGEVYIRSATLAQFTSLILDDGLFITNLLEKTLLSQDPDQEIVVSKWVSVNGSFMRTASPNKALRPVDPLQWLDDASATLKLEQRVTFDSISSSSASSSTNGGILTISDVITFEQLLSYNAIKHSQKSNPPISLLSSPTAPASASPSQQVRDVASVTIQWNIVEVSDSTSRELQIQLSISDIRIDGSESFHQMVNGHKNFINEELQVFYKKYTAFAKAYIAHRVLKSTKPLPTTPLLRNLPGLFARSKHLPAWAAKEQQNPYCHDNLPPPTTGPRIQQLPVVLPSPSSSSSGSTSTAGKNSVASSPQSSLLSSPSSSTARDVLQEVASIVFASSVIGGSISHIKQLGVVGCIGRYHGGASNDKEENVEAEGGEGPEEKEEHDEEKEGEEEEGDGEGPEEKEEHDEEKEGDEEEGDGEGPEEKEEHDEEKEGDEEEGDGVDLLRSVDSCDENDNHSHHKEEGSGSIYSGDIIRSTRLDSRFEATKEEEERTTTIIISGGATNCSRSLLEEDGCYEAGEDSSQGEYYKDRVFETTTTVVGTITTNNHSGSHPADCMNSSSIVYVPKNASRSKQQHQEGTNITDITVGGLQQQQLRGITTTVSLPPHPSSSCSGVVCSLCGRGREGKVRPSRDSSRYSSILVNDVSYGLFMMVLGAFIAGAVLTYHIDEYLKLISD